MEEEGGRRVRGKEETWRMEEEERGGRMGEGREYKKGGHM